MLKDIKNLLRPVINKIRYYNQYTTFRLQSWYYPDEVNALLNGFNKMAMGIRLNIDPYSCPSFFQYITAINFANNNKRNDVALEIGTGYSSLLLPKLKHGEKTEIFSLDVKPIEEYGYAKELKTISRHVKFLNGFSITQEEWNDFYDGSSKEVFLGIDAKELKKNLDKFIREYYTDNYYQEMNLDAKNDFVGLILERLFDGNRIRCLSRLFPRTFSCDSSWDYPSGSSILDELINKVEFFDYIFFDSGEFSSMIEFMKLKDKIRPGGIAAFHDIYFPKSIKNFLVCASLACSPEWEIIYQDDTTIQGLLLARRVTS